MTVSSENFKDQYWGDGSTATFNVTTQFQNASELLVTVLSADGLTESTKLLTSQYTVSGGSGGAGQITFTGGNIPAGTGAPGSEKITITRKMPLLQQTDLTANDPFPADTVERSLGDRLIMIVQQQQERLNRAVKLLISSSLASPPELLDPVANTVLLVSADATKIGPGPTADQVANAQTYSVNSAASAAAAAVSAASVSALTSVGFRNRLINGGITIAERPAVTPNTGWQIGAVDRIQYICTGTGITATATKVFNAAFRSGSALQINGSWTNGQVGVRQNIMSEDVIDLTSKANQTITQSILVYQNTGAAVNFDVAFYKPNAYNDFSAITFLSQQTVSVPNNVVTKISCTRALSPSDTINGLQAVVFQSAVKTVASKTFLFSDWQVEVGSVATEYDVRPFEIERLLCEGFSQKSFPNDIAPAAATTTVGSYVDCQPVAAGGTFGFTIPLRRRMRNKSPTVTLYNPVNAGSEVYNYNAAANCSGTVLNLGVNDTNLSIQAVASAGSGVGTFNGIHYWVRTE